MPETVILIPMLVLGAFTFSFAGFGFALTVLPILAFFLPVKTAVAFLFPYQLALVFYHSWKYGRLIDRRLLWPVVLGAYLALPFGLMSLNRFPEPLLKRLLAAFIVAAVAVNRVNYERRKRPEGKKTAIWGFACGIISGWFQGAYTTGGPPAVVYIMSASRDPAATKGYIGAYFVLVNIVTAILFAMGGVFSGEWLKATLVYSPAVLLGVVLGALVSKKVGVRVYRAVVDVLLCLAALMLWIRT